MKKNCLNCYWEPDWSTHRGDFHKCSFGCGYDQYGYEETQLKENLPIGYKVEINESFLYVSDDEEKVYYGTDKEVENCPVWEEAS